MQKGCKQQRLGFVHSILELEIYFVRWNARVHKARQSYVLFMDYELNLCKYLLMSDMAMSADYRSVDHKLFLRLGTDQKQ